MIKENIKESIILGIVIGILISIGFFIKRDGTVIWNAQSIFTILGSVAINIVIADIAFLIADKVREKDSRDIDVNTLPWINRRIKSSFIYFCVAFIVILILWIPAFLALYPGLFIYDAPWQYSMYKIDEVTAHHPVLHTYMLGGIIDTVHKATGSINKGAAAYSLVQMCIMALGYAYILYVFHREKVSTVIHIIAYLVWAIFPVSSIFSVAMTKDSIFSVLLADFIVINYLLLRDGEDFFKRKSNYILWVVFAVIVLIFRNNAKYAIVLVAPFMLVRLIKHNRKLRQGDGNTGFGYEKFYILKCIGMFLATVIIFVIYSYPICNAVTVKGISTEEMLSVPCQQLARVYNYHSEELCEEEKNQIEQIFGYSELLLQYVPQQATNTKGCVDVDYIKDNLGSTLVFWARLGMKFPEEYIDSFLENTYPFWYMWPRYVVYCDGGETYIPMLSIVPVEQNTKLPLLYDFYKEFETGNIVQGYGWISWIFSPAFYFYIFIYAAMYSFKVNKEKYYPLFLCVLLLWFTYMLGPVAQIRYAFYLLCLIPCWGLILRKSK